MYGFTYRISGNHAIMNDEAYPICDHYAEIWQPLPIIGQKYLVVSFCDYDNTEYGENYTITVTEENIAEITYHMNDTTNDITSYHLCTEENENLWKNVPASENWN